jgi:hypothetical protein
VATPGVYLSNDAMAEKIAVGAMLDYTDKFVSDGALETGVAPGDLEVSVANA